MCQVPDRPEFPKKLISLDLQRFSTSNLTQTTVLISPMKVSVQRFILTGQSSIGKFLVSVLASEGLKSERFKRCH